MEIDFNTENNLDLGFSSSVSMDESFGIGETPSGIDVVKVDGTPLPVVNKSVNIDLATPLSQKADKNQIPTKTSQLTNDSGYITNTDVPTKTSQLTNDGSNGTSTYVEASQLATVATSGSYNDLSNTPNSFLIRAALSANTNLNGLSAGIYPVNNLVHPDFPVAGAMYGALIQYPDTYKTQVLIAGEAAGGGNENNMYYRRWLTSTSSFTAWASAQGSSITVDSALNASSTNPVENQALYPAIVPKEIYKTVYTYEWTGPAGTNLYNCVAIITMPAGTFTENSLVELVNQDDFNTFAKHGFVLYGSEVATQRLWITSIGKPTSTLNFKFRIYKWGN